MQLNSPQQHQKTVFEKSIVGNNKDSCSELNKHVLNNPSLSSLNKSNEKIFKIPLINKRLNSVEKYISTFKNSIEKNKGNETISPSEQSRLYSIHYLSVDQSIKEQQEDVQRENMNKCHVKYESTVQEYSKSRLDTLDKVQEQYIRLKKNMIGVSSALQYQTEGVSQDNTHKNQTKFHHQLIRNRKISKQQNGIKLNWKRKFQASITEEQVEKELKNSMVNENGKKFYADLYLLKKGRDKVISSLSTVGKQSLNKPLQFNNNQSYSDNQKYQSSKNPSTQLNHSNTNSSYLQSVNQLKKKYHNKNYHSYSINEDANKYKHNKTYNNKSNSIDIVNVERELSSLPMNYDQQVKQNQQKFVYNKIMKERSEKKNKMLKGKNLHWNVYYQMLALQPNQKKKLKGVCKFSETYGLL